MRKNPLKLNATYVSLYDHARMNSVLPDVLITFLEKFDKLSDFKKHRRLSIQGRPFPFGLSRIDLHKKMRDSALTALKGQMGGAMQPLADAIKDGVDALKFYKGTYQLKRDLLQPVHGIGNIFKGLAILVFFIPYSIVIIIYLAVSACRGRTTNKRAQPMQYGRALQHLVTMFLSWGVDAISSIVRGITQIAFTPLTYLVKIPLRMLITSFFTELEDRTIEKNKGIERLLDAADAVIQLEKFPLEEARSILQELNEKHLKARMRGQTTQMQFGQIEKFRELANATFPCNKEKNQVLPDVRQEELIQIYGFFRPGSYSEGNTRSTSEQASLLVSGKG